MVKVVSDGQYVPWYSRRSCPVFCFPCVPVYMGVWKGRKAVLIIGAVLFCIGVMMALATLLACVATECAALWLSAGGLLPLAIILIIVGLLLVHCGWAAHLLDDNGELEIKKTTTTTTTTYRDAEGQPDPAEQLIFQSAYRESAPQVRQGYWQFEDREAWQTAANPYPIQSTLKPCLERIPY